MQGRLNIMAGSIVQHRWWVGSAGPVCAQPPHDGNRSNERLAISSPTCFLHTTTFTNHPHSCPASPREPPHSLLNHPLLSPIAPPMPNPAAAPSTLGIALVMLVIAANGAAGRPLLQAPPTGVVAAPPTAATHAASRGG